MTLEMMSLVSFPWWWSGRRFTLFNVKGAQNAGLLGGLVRTGKYRDGDENRFQEKPDFVFNSLLEMAKSLVRN